MGRTHPLSPIVEIGMPNYSASFANHLAKASVTLTLRNHSPFDLIWTSSHLAALHTFGAVAPSLTELSNPTLPNNHIPPPSQLSERPVVSSEWPYPTHHRRQPSSPLRRKRRKLRRCTLTRSPFFEERESIHPPTRRRLS